MPFDAAAQRRVPCAICAHDFDIAAVLDVNGYPVCRRCLEDTSRGVQTGPRRFAKIRHGKMIAGVCGGLARYSNFDVTALRVLVVAAAFMTFGAVVLAYVLLAFVIPTEP